MICTLSRMELEAMIESRPGLILVEVSPLESYRRSHIPGAIHRDEDSTALWETSPGFGIPPGTPLVIYSDSARSPGPHRLARQLSELDYPEIYIYAGGKEDWLEAGRATVSDDYSGVARPPAA